MSPSQDQPELSEQTESLSAAASGQRDEMLEDVKHADFSSLPDNSAHGLFEAMTEDVRVGNPFTPIPPTLSMGSEEENLEHRPLSFSPSSPRLRPRRRQMGMIVVLASVVILAMAQLFPLLWASPQFTTLTTTASGTATVGQVVFSSSGQLTPNGTQGINDIVTVMVHSLKNPTLGKALFAWLLPDQTNNERKPILLGTATPHHGTLQLTYNDLNHEDLLTTYSAFLITEQDQAVIPITPSSDPALWRDSGGIPATPAPGDENHYSLLSHLRHLLAMDPNLQAIGLSGGLDIWLDRNSEKILEYATAARDDWPNQGGTASLTHRQMVRILQYLDGINYSWQDTPKGTPWLIDPQAGHIGLLDFSTGQEPPGYLSHVLLHLNGLINAPGSTPTQKQLAIQITDEMQTIVPLYNTIRSDARLLVKMSDPQLRQHPALSLLDTIVTKANDAYTGQFNSATGTSQSGINTIHGQLQTLGIFPVMTIN